MLAQRPFSNNGAKIQDNENHSYLKNLYYLDSGSLESNSKK